MNEIVIEKNIPMPSVAGRRAGPYLVAIRKMEIGDSFLVTGNISKRSAIGQMGKKAGIPLSLRRVNESDFRVWRVAGKIKK